MLLRYFLFFIFISSQASAQHDLDKYIDSVGRTAKVSLIVQNLEGNILYELNSHSKIPSASIIKIPILFQLFSQIEEGKTRLDELHKLTADDKVGGSGELQHKPEGSHYSMETLAREMIRLSDNTATNIIIKRLGLSTVNAMMVNLGMKSTQLNRLMMDFDAIDEGRQNYTSPAEMNELLLMLNSADFLSFSSRELILEMLSNCDDKNTIPSQLPNDIAVAHKTGILDYVRGDAGIIYSPNPIVVSIFVEDFSSYEEAEEIIGTISRMVYETYGHS